MLILLALGRLLVVLCSFEFTLFKFDWRSQFLDFATCKFLPFKVLKVFLQASQLKAPEVAFHYNSDMTFHRLGINLHLGYYKLQNSSSHVILKSQLVIIVTRPS